MLRRVLSPFGVEHGKNACGQGINSLIDISFVSYKPDTEHSAPQVVVE